MICPKCNSPKQYDNYCSMCGNPFRERCPECGKMEHIGRKVCESSVTQATEKKWCYIDRKKWVWFSLTMQGMFASLYLPIFIALPFFRANILNPDLVGLYTALSLLITLMSVILPSYGVWRKIIKKRKREFVKLFPVETEILRKAGERK